MSEPQVSPLVAAVTCRCPRCGKGALYRQSFDLALRDKCENCGLSYAFIDTGDGPAVFVIMLLGFIMLGAALILEFTFHPQIWLHAILWIPGTLILALGLLRPLKALLIALQFHNKAAQGQRAD
jgi:uncharacterized protein (DUF983 family)